MVQVIEDGRSEEGFPFVRWEQEVPTAQSLHTVQQSINLKIATVVMVFVFVAVFAASEQFWTGLLAAVVIGGIWLSGDKMFKGGIRVWDTHIAGPEPREGAAEEERRARATAILAKESRGIGIQPDETQELYVWVWKGDGKNRDLVRRAPLASIEPFELGTFEEWFEDVSTAELRRQASSPNSYVIVLPTLGHGVIPVAESAGAKADIVALHGLLTKRFVIDAGEILQRWKEKREDAEREARSLSGKGEEAGEGGNAAGTRDH